MWRGITAHVLFFLLMFAKLINYYYIIKKGTVDQEIN